MIFDLFWPVLRLWPVNDPVPTHPPHPRLVKFLPKKNCPETCENILKNPHNPHLKSGKVSTNFAKQKKIRAKIQIWPKMGLKFCKIFFCFATCVATFPNLIWGSCGYLGLFKKDYGQFFWAKFDPKWLWIWFFCSIFSCSAKFVETFRDLIWVLCTSFRIFSNFLDTFVLPKFD